MGVTLVAVPGVVRVPDVLAGLAAGSDVDLAAAALDIADRLPVNGPQLVLESVRGSENRWMALAGARELLRAVALDDPTDLRFVAALGLLSIATRLEVDRRRGVRYEDVTE